MDYFVRGDGVLEMVSDLQVGRAGSQVSPQPPLQHSALARTFQTTYAAAAAATATAAAAATATATATAAPPLPPTPSPQPISGENLLSLVASEPRSAIWELGVFFWRLVWMEAVAR